MCPNFLDSDSNEIPLTILSLNYLEEARKWVLFLSIIGFISAGFSMLGALQYIIGGIGLLLGGSSMNEFQEILGGSVSPITLAVFALLGGILYAGIGAVGIYQSMYEYKFSDYSQKAIKSSSNQFFSLAINNLAKSFRLKGITALVGIGLSIIFIIGLIVFLSFNSDKLQDLKNSSEKIFTYTQIINKYIKS